MSDVASSLVLTERRGRVTIVQLNRPQALNSLSPELLDELLAVLTQLDGDQDVGAVVIAGHDRAFVAGADIKGMQHRSVVDVLTARASRFWFRLAEIEIPLVAAVSGPAYGGGCELALACDLIVASSTASFSQAEIKVGIMPGGGGTQRWARAIGKHRTMELVLTGRAVTAHEAERFGVVNIVTEPQQWLPAAIELAERVAAGPPLAVRWAKKAVLAAEEASLTAGMQLERRLMEATFATADREEGMTAFLERRAPVWSGA